MISQTASSDDLSIVLVMKPDKFFELNLISFFEDIRRFNVENAVGRSMTFWIKSYKFTLKKPNNPASFIPVMPDVEVEVKIQQTIFEKEAPYIFASKRGE